MLLKRRRKCKRQCELVLRPVAVLRGDLSKQRPHVTGCVILRSVKLRAPVCSGLFVRVVLLQRAIKLTGGRRQRKIDRCLFRINASDIEASEFEFFPFVLQCPS